MPTCCCAGFLRDALGLGNPTGTALLLLPRSVDDAAPAGAPGDEDVLGRTLLPLEAYKRSRSSRARSFICFAAGVADVDEGCGCAADVGAERAFCAPVAEEEEAAAPLPPPLPIEEASSILSSLSLEPSEVLPAAVPAAEAFEASCPLDTVVDDVDAFLLRLFAVLRSRFERFGITRKCASRSFVGGC